MFSNPSIVLESQIPFPKEKLLTTKESPNQLLAFVSKFLFSFPSALLHGSMLLPFALPLFAFFLQEPQLKASLRGSEPKCAQSELGCW